MLAVPIVLAIAAPNNFPKYERAHTDPEQVDVSQCRNTDRRRVPPSNTITVTNTNDSGAGSLRQALADANDGDTINFAVTGTIGLTNGELLIDQNITISGPGPDILAVSRSSNVFRIFHVMSAHTVTIEGLTIEGGYGDSGGGIWNDHATLTINNCAVVYNASLYNGGGIFSDGSNGSATLTIIDSIVSSNFSPAGGGIDSDVGNQGIATLTVINSTVSNNISTNGSPPKDFGSAGGIASSGTAMIIDSTVSNNLASNSGGGILSGGTLTINNSTISGNRAGGFGENNWPGSGGGISAYGLVTLNNSTVSGNVAWGSGVKGPGHGGGIDGNVMTVSNSTISGNSATICGGICPGGASEISNTILNANSPTNIDGTITSQGYNVSSDNGSGNLTGPGDQINIDPLLGPLQDNGGQTFTQALLAGSPAIDAGDPNFVPPPDYDQRGPGHDRVVNGRIDIGAFEVQIVTPTVTGAVSRKVHGGTGTFDINMPLTGPSGIECRTTGGTNDYTLVVHFSANVTVTGSPQAQLTTGTGCVGTAGTCSGNVSVSGAVVTVPLTNIGNAQNINVRINGVNGSNNFDIPMSILIGDTNANATVNAADVAQTKGRLGQTVGTTNFRSDVNANGVINAADTAIVKQNSGTSLPP